MNKEYPYKFLANDAAVDEMDLAGDIASLFRGKIYHRVGDLGKGQLLRSLLVSNARIALL